MITFEIAESAWRSGRDGILSRYITAENQRVDGVSIHACRWVNVGILLQHVRDATYG